MNQDIQKFIELLKTDESVSEKLKVSAENYTGEKTLDATFQNLIAPAAEEAGLHFNQEEYQEYVVQQTRAIQELSLDELDQVAGGDYTVGTTLNACYKIGFGAGIATKIKDDGSTAGQSFCFIIGWGEAAACFVRGASTDIVKPTWNNGD